MIEARAAGIDAIHIDYLDGKFTPGSRAFDCSEQVRKISALDIPMVVHLMSVHPDFNIVEEMLAAGLRPQRDRVLIHYDSFGNEQDLRDLAKRIRQSDLEVGLVLNPETPLAVLGHFSDILGTQINSVMLMAIIPGAGSRPFIPGTLERISELRKFLRDEKIENVAIEIDGGINEATLENILNRGVDTFVSRAWLLNSNINFGEGLSRIDVLLKRQNMEKEALVELLQDGGIAVDQYILDEIIYFCSG